MTAAIQTTGLTKRYGAVQALTDLTLDVRHREVCGFLGPNGAGKTTTAREDRRDRERVARRAGQAAARFELVGDIGA